MAGKQCTECGTRFVGLGALCSVCERDSRHVTQTVTPVTQRNAKPENVTKPVTQRNAPETPVTRRDQLEAERLGLLERLAEINREIGPMPNAERQRRWRARRRSEDG